jgi:hypothetical protein
VAPAWTGPHGLQEPDRTILDISTVVAAHDWLDSLRSLVGVVEGDGADIVMEHVGFNNAVEESPADETEFAVNSCSSTTNIVPAFTSVVRKSWVSVLEIGDSNWWGTLAVEQNSEI